MCELLAADAAYAAGSGGGIVTDKPYVVFAVVCTHAVLLCADCLRVHGPTAARIDALRPLPHLQGRGYEGVAAWEEQYQGPVRVSMAPPQCAPAHRYCTRTAGL